MKKDRKNILMILMLFLCAAIIVAAIFYKINFAEQTFETIMYQLTKGNQNANTEIVGKAIKICIIPVCILLIILAIPLTNFNNQKIIKIKNFQIYPNNLILKHKKRYIIIMLIISIGIGLEAIGFYTYIKNQIHKSTIFEDEYVVSENVNITFPEKKRNLIYIFLESMETSLTSKENGGGWEYSIIPELEKLAKDNINFSNTNKLGGAMSVPGTTWTVAGMVSQTSGTPLKMDIDPNAYSGYSSFLPGVYSLGDILKKEGYNLKLMIGSDASFGGRRDYFTIHGNYEIFDFYTAIEEGKMKKEDEVWWGYDDDNLFKWAKNEVLELADKEEPFNFILLTADTHFEDGYLSKNAEQKYDTQYENVFAYSSKSVCKFIEWIKEQDFYDNTTIVVVGDHLGMQSEFYDKHLENEYIRTVYNTFINPAIPEANSKNRLFSTLDIFPTVLASIGAKIEGERLGLGTNLFSGKETLMEQIGYDKLCNELAKRSTYYNKFLLQDNYIEMLKK